MKDRMVLISGSASRELTEEIASILEVSICPINVIRFANDNLMVKILENVREADVFVVQTSIPPVNEHLWELLMLIDALKHASARRITAVMPYYPYVRSDKKDEARISITARLVADLLQSAGANRILTMNLHAPQIQGFFHIPADQLMATKIICEYFHRKNIQDAVSVAPDAGSAKRTSLYAEHLNLPIAILDKRRTDHTEKPVIHRIIGEVKDKNAIIFDDEVSTGGSLKEVITVLKEAGAKSIHACCVHPVLVGPAVDRINQAGLQEFVTTNTIPLQGKQITNCTVLSVAELFAEAIRCIHYGVSLSKLFKQYDREFK